MCSIEYYQIQYNSEDRLKLLYVNFVTKYFYVTSVLKMTVFKVFCSQKIERQHRQQCRMRQFYIVSL